MLYPSLMNADLARAIRLLDADTISRNFQDHVALQKRDGRIGTQHQPLADYAVMVDGGFSLVGIPKIRIRSRRQQPSRRTQNDGRNQEDVKHRHLLEFDSGSAFLKVLMAHGRHFIFFNDTC